MGSKHRQFLVKDGAKWKWVDEPDPTTPDPKIHFGGWRRSQESIALSCHPNQVEEFNQKAVSARTGAYYKPDGTAVLDSRDVRRRECINRGIMDRDAGYGDAAGS